MEVAQRHQDKLDRIKKSVRNSYEYFQSNYDRYNEFRKFVFESSLTDDEISLLASLSKPQLEFNILEAYISRLLGEFSKQEPDIEVSAANPMRADPLIINIVMQHLRHVFSDDKNNHTRYEVYKDLLSGGFSVLKVINDYANPMSFQQVINIERAFDPTLCGFDQLSKASHKGDGRFCFELAPISKEDFKIEYPDVNIDKLSFVRNFGGFNWSYINNNEPYLLRCDYYEKKKKEVKIVQLNDDRVMKYDKYKELLDNWSEFAAPPAIIGEPRKTILNTIVRYRLIENHVLKYEETDYTHLPLVFVDGNSALIRDHKNGNIRQVTRPYVYHAKGAQRLKNYAGISVANEIENIVQHKFIIKKEALPKEQDFLDAITNVQKPSNIVVNAFYEENPDQPIPDPISPIIKMPAPPEVAQAFQSTDSLMQNILGSYDAALGINNNQLSGIAIVEAASQSNATAMPYIVGFLQGMQRAAQIYVDLMPKYFTLPGTLPIVDDDGKRSFVMINQNEGIPLEFDSSTLNVSLKAGASFQVQKSRTLMLVKEMMGMSPIFSQFIAEKGLNFVLDQMEGKGIEELKALTKQWMQEYEQQKQQQQQLQQQAMMNNPAMMRNQLQAQKMQQDAQKNQQQFALDMTKLRSDQEKLLADISMTRESNSVQALKANTERFAKEVDLALKHKDMSHKHSMDIHDRLKGDNHA